MNLDLSGKLALVTGSEGGLGEKIAIRLARNGANVIVHYVLSREKAEAVARELTSYGVQAYLVHGDFSTAEGVAEMMRQTREIGDPDILINNAGILKRMKLLSAEAGEEEVWEKSFQVNYMSVVRTMREFLPYMCKAGWGRVVNISSVSCRIRSSLGATVAYTPMKSAVEALTVHVSDEVAQYGVTCNCVGPGNMRTPMVANAPLPDPRTLELYHTRRNADPDEIAATVEYLASPDASFVTGEIFYTAGGR